jgi:hypothetical protein
MQALKSLQRVNFGGLIMVQVMRHKSNSQLIEWLREHSHLDKRQLRRKRDVVYRATKWRLQDRLTERDVVRLVMAFRTGIAMKALAKRYGMNVKSVRKLLRECEVKTRPRCDIQSSSAAPKSQGYSPGECQLRQHIG